MWRLCLQPVRSSLYLHVGTDWIMLHVNRKSLRPQALRWELWWGKEGRSRGKTAAAPRSSTLHRSTGNRMTAFLSVSFPDFWVGANWSALAPAAVQQAKLPEADVSGTGPDSSVQEVQGSASFKKPVDWINWQSVQFNKDATQSLSGWRIKGRKKKKAASQERREDKAEQRKTHWKKKSYEKLHCYKT